MHTNVKRPGVCWDEAFRMECGWYFTVTTGMLAVLPATRTVPNHDLNTASYLDAAMRLEDGRAGSIGLAGRAAFGFSAPEGKSWQALLRIRRRLGEDWVLDLSTGVSREYNPPPQLAGVQYDPTGLVTDFRFAGERSGIGGIFGVDTRKVRERRVVSFAGIGFVGERDETTVILYGGLALSMAPLLQPKWCWSAGALPACERFLFVEASYATPFSDTHGRDGECPQDSSCLQPSSDFVSRWQFEIGPMMNLTPTHAFGVTLRRAIGVRDSSGQTVALKARDRRRVGQLVIDVAGGPAWGHRDDGQRWLEVQGVTGSVSLAHRALPIAVTVGGDAFKPDVTRASGYVAFGMRP